MRVARILGAAIVGVTFLVPQSASSQDWTQREYPLAPPNAVGNFVAPYFDGFYQNEDGTYTLSFGFMNRNDSELIEIPLGENNFIEPAEYDGMQPTSFPVVSYTGFGGPRERGAFAVIVPEDFEGDVWWTVTTDGYTTRVPGRLESPGEIIKGAYELSTTPMAGGSLRPKIRFGEDDEYVIGIEGLEHPETFQTAVGEPIAVQFWAQDNGERELGEVNVSLWKHQGPVGGQIAFESLTTAPAPMAEGEGRGAAAGGRSPFAGRGPIREPGPVEQGRYVRLPTEGPEAHIGRFTATFDTPGDYMIRIKVDNYTAGDSSSGNQCCWTNGYVRVSVHE